MGNKKTLSISGGTASFGSIFIETSLKMDLLISPLV